MASINASELRSFTTEGSQQSAAATYAAVRTALANYPPLAAYDLDIFLQGSYANHTNTRGDSDVDIVVMLKTTYQPDISRLSPPEVATYHSNWSPATTTADQLRSHVHAALDRYFGSSRVHPRNKCIRVDKSDGYVDADVVPCVQHRRYLRFPPFGAPTYIEGISIRPISGETIVNFPKRHIANGETKNKDCSGAYKPTVRQVKRVRRRAVDLKLLGPKDAPGYVLECMTYNVPKGYFGGDEAVRVHSVLDWLGQFSASELESEIWSCDEIYHLFRDDPGLHSAATAARVIATLRGLL